MWADLICVALSACGPACARAGLGKG